jgi:hypothetical protein
MSLSTTKTLVQILDEARARKEQGNWTPASGGTETPFTTRSGRVLLYVFQASTGRHAYLDTQTDLILSQEEAEAALGMVR